MLSSNSPSCESTHSLTVSIYSSSFVNPPCPKSVSNIRVVWHGGQFLRSGWAAPLWLIFLGRCSLDLCECVKRQLIRWPIGVVGEARRRSLWKAWVGEGKTEGGRGWGTEGVCVCVCVLRKAMQEEREGGWRVLKLLMGKEKGGVRETSKHQRGEGGVSGKSLFSMRKRQSHFHCWVRARCSRWTSERKKVCLLGFFGAVFVRSSSPPLSGTPLEVVCANEASGGHNGAKCLWQLGRCTADGGRG